MGVVGYALSLGGPLGGGGGGVPGADSRVLVKRSGTQQTGNTAPATVVFNTEVVNVGSWTTNLGTGEVTVPAGVTHVHLLFQWEAGAPGGTTTFDATIEINGVGIQSLSGYEVGVSGGAAVLVVASTQANSAYARFVPVSEGDVIRCRVFTSSSTWALVIDNTWLYVEKAA